MPKYNQTCPVFLENRKWPSKIVEKAPEFCSVDLRDGNQALCVPMSSETKLKFFDYLVKIGFKQIEVGFPSSSQTEYDFLRCLIEQNRIPSDVTVQVLCPVKENFIKTTFESLRGLKKAIFHIYNATSPIHRKYNFGLSKDEIKNLALNGVRSVKKMLFSYPEIQIQLEYSPEDFSNTEMDFVLEICEAVKDEWQPTFDNKLIINLPETVQCNTPNVYADQIEYFCTHFSDLQNVIVSAHNHNDRGTGVAACELALLAGANRVEGTLFGNGERTGNLDIVNLALNLYAKGIDPHLDFSHLNEISAAYTKFTGMEIPSRQPYSGSLVFTSFSGGHQDAIRKGLKARKQMAQDEAWEVPYLVIDPRDVGRQYGELIRINSQSGKSGSAWILEQDFGLFLPKSMQGDFGMLVKNKADKLNRELLPQEIFDLFYETWLNKEKTLRILDFSETHVDGSDKTNNVLCRGSISLNGKNFAFGAKGNGPLDAFVSALNDLTDSYGNGVIEKLVIRNFYEHSIGTGSDTDAMAYVQLAFEKGAVVWGAGKSSNVARAGVDAVVSAVNRHLSVK